MAIRGKLSEGGVAFKAFSARNWFELLVFVSYLDKPNEFT
ncbi:hypothetical protein AGR1A_Lc110074 [Agrobacterium fabacearum CFBP 5771]|nr:hypothetical protein AGR1A_Lc110074 [Agrobacterium fabacearum CFBP 5771]